jgi:DNA-binding transcriptional MocR family regulator/signal transduction histidine kinase
MSSISNEPLLGSSHQSQNFKPPFLSVLSATSDSPRNAIRAFSARKINERLKTQQIGRQFVAMVSHELRTPLSSVQISIDMISEGLFGELSEVGKQQLKRAERSIDRMTVLINDLLNLERLQEAEFSVNPQLLQFDEVIEEALEATSFRASATGVLVHYEGAPESCFADRARLVQVLTNLIDNAIKFSQPRQSIEILTHRLKDFLEIRVKDRGRGIPEEMQDQIFERFVQVCKKDRMKRNGSGLGLAICKAIVLNHGGEIGVISKPGEGSTFWFRLPLQKPADKITSWCPEAQDKSSNATLGHDSKSHTRSPDKEQHRVDEIPNLAKAMAACAAFSVTPSRELPVKSLQKSLFKAAKMLGQLTLGNEADPFGQIDLREQLQQLVFRTRGIDCSPEQIIIFPSTEGGLDLLCRLTLTEESVVAIEDPCFPGIRKHLSMNCLWVCPVPIDSEGISVNSIRALPKTPQLVYVTPAHQDTIGLTMSEDRRTSLLEWANQNGSLIVEDDYGCEFTYDQLPQAALFAQDRSEHVIYKYNFWKALYPLVRMSFMIIPKSLIALFRSTLVSTHQDIPSLEQLALAIQIKEGHYERHIEKQNRLFARRRKALVGALATSLGEQLSICQQTGGTHLTVRFHPELCLESIEARAVDCGIEILSTRSCYSMIEPPTNEYLISFSSIDESKIEGQIADFTAGLLAGKRM